jgi:hypothetical protein
VGIKFLCVGVCALIMGLDLCAWESRNNIRIQVPTNEPPISKRKVLTSHALITCNVVF